MNPLNDQIALVYLLSKRKDCTKYLLAFGKAIRSRTSHLNSHDVPGTDGSSADLPSGIRDNAERVRCICAFLQKNPGQTLTALVDSFSGNDKLLQKEMHDFIHANGKSDILSSVQESQLSPRFSRTPETTPRGQNERKETQSMSQTSVQQRQSLNETRIEISSAMFPKKMVAPSASEPGQSLRVPTTASSSPGEAQDASFSNGSNSTLWMSKRSKVFSPPELYSRRQPSKEISDEKGPLTPRRAQHSTPLQNQTEYDQFLSPKDNIPMPTEQELQALGQNILFKDKFGHRERLSPPRHLPDSSDALQADIASPRRQLEDTSDYLGTNSFSPRRQLSDSSKKVETSSNRPSVWMSKRSGVRPSEQSLPSPEFSTASDLNPESEASGPMRRSPDISADQRENHAFTNSSTMTRRVKPEFNSRPQENQIVESKLHDREKESTQEDLIAQLYQRLHYTAEAIRYLKNSTLSVIAAKEEETKLLGGGKQDLINDRKIPKQIETMTSIFDQVFEAASVDTYRASSGSTTGLRRSEGSRNGSLVLASLDGSSRQMRTAHTHRDHPRDHHREHTKDGDGDGEGRAGLYRSQDSHRSRSKSPEGRFRRRDASTLLPPPGGGFKRLADMSTNAFLNSDHSFRGQDQSLEEEGRSSLAKRTTMYGDATIKFPLVSAVCPIPRDAPCSCQRALPSCCLLAAFLLPSCCLLVLVAFLFCLLIGPVPCLILCLPRVCACVCMCVRR
jgi:hypothetical protein